MKINNLNKDFFKNINKYKSLILIPLAIGTMTLSGCELLTQKSFDPNEALETVSDQEYENYYPAEIIVTNADLLDCEDYIIFGEENEVAYGGFRSRNHTFKTEVPDNSYTISSRVFREMKAQVNVEEGEKAYIYIDYATKTITVEKELEIHKTR